MASTTTTEVAQELPGHIRVYRDGTIERLFVLPVVPPSPHTPDPKSGVFSKDIVISDDPRITARLFLPSNLNQQEKLPVLVYYHGGAFCIGSATFSLIHLYISALASQARAICVSVDYRLAPEHPLPAAYEDCWDALKFVAAHRVDLVESDFGVGEYKDPWIVEHADFDRLFIGGDSSGGNLVHNVLLKAGRENLPGNVKVLGAFLGHPHFWGSSPIGNEPVENHDKNLARLAWEFAYPSAENGIDHHMINPAAPGAPSLTNLGCSKLLVCVAEKDFLRERGVLYHQLVKESEWSGKLEELFEVKEEEHGFHMWDVETENAKLMIGRMVTFIKSGK